MLFHSQAFLLVFLPAVLSLYYMLARHVAAREWLIIAASAIFYAWWDVRFLPLLLGEVTVAWLVAELYFRTGLKWLLTAGLVATLVVLGVFKYLDFFAGSLMRLIGHPVAPSGIVLPIGISFFTFQIVSYFIDAGRGDAPRYGFRRFALVILLFPHLIAGPIVRHVELVPQFDASPLRDGLAERMVRGLTLFLVGFLAKVFLADKLAPHVDEIFAASASATPQLAQAWAGALGFALQIYFDFAAYSEMAMGLALMLGLSFPMNFNMPYRATNLQDFWRRWHMSLSRFLRDYLYIPLGGSRYGLARFTFATMTTMGLCGLWHGAGWPFVVWGLVHGAGLVVCRAWTKFGVPLPAALGWLATFFFAVMAFVPFRAPDMTTTLHMLSGLIGSAGLGPLPSGRLIALLAIAVLLAHLPRSNPDLVERYLKPHPALAAASAALACWAILEVGRGQPASFIYFQF
jgi:D-alanyl-lipoteichoic acid acyltransferase DltB (MBOAT superfamily)